ECLGVVETPDSYEIDGLSPPFSIEKGAGGHNPRSTVGTVTEIYDYLRLLYARAGTPHCANCGRAVERQSAGQIADTLLGWPEGTRVEILAPLVRGRKGEFRDLFESARKQGFVRAVVDGALIELAEPPKLNRKVNHDVSVVVDRLAVRADDRGPLTDSLETALRLADGMVQVSRHGGGKTETQLFSEKYGCPNCGISMPELEPRHFSFNSPFGACPACSGLGTRRSASAELVLGDPSISLLEGVVLPWGEPDGYLRRVILPGLAKQLKFELNVPWGALPERVQEVLLHGLSKKRGDPESAGKWEGILSNVQRRYNETTSDSVRGELEDYMVVDVCPECNGKRLKPESLAVTIAGRNIGEFGELSVSEANDFVLSIPLRAPGQPGLDAD